MGVYKEFLLICYHIFMKAIIYRVVSKPEYWTIRKLNILSTARNVHRNT